MSTVSDKMKKRVAIFRSELLPISETFIRDQASALSEWEPVLLGRMEVPGGLETPNVQREIIPESGCYPVRSLRYWLWRPDPNIVRRLQQLNVSLVHAHFGIGATDIWPSVKAANLPMVVTLHGMDINIHQWWWKKGHGGLRRRVYPCRLKKMAQDPNVSFIAVSNAIKRRAIEQGIPEEKITVSYIGVDTEKFKPLGLPIEKRKKRILFVGRMVEKKAPLLMVRAFHEVRKQVPDAELVMIGTGPLLEDAKRLARSLDVPVSFLGAQNSEEVTAQLHQTRVFCLPSITASNGDAEGLPISILEAMACGIPVVTSANGAVNEAIFHKENGLCFKENDIKELSENIISIISNHQYLLELSNAARRIATEKFAISKTIKFLERNIYPKQDRY